MARHGEEHGRKVGGSLQVCPDFHFQGCWLLVARMTPASLALVKVASRLFVWS